MAQKGALCYILIAKRRRAQQADVLIHLLQELNWGPHALHGKLPLGAEIGMLRRGAAALLGRSQSGADAGYRASTPLLSRNGR